MKFEEQEFDSTGRPVCARCKVRIFQGDVFCESCAELIRFKQSQRLREWIPPIIPDGDDE